MFDVTDLSFCSHMDNCQSDKTCVVQYVTIVSSVLCSLVDPYIEYSCLQYKGALSWLP